MRVPQRTCRRSVDAVVMPVETPAVLVVMELAFLCGEDDGVVAGIDGIEGLK